MKANTKKYWIIPVVLIAVAIIPLFFLLRKKKSEETVSDPVTSTTSNSMADFFPLKRGSSGNNVKRLQVFLNRKISLNEIPIPYAALSNIAEDGIFGEITENTTWIVLHVKEVSKELFNLNNM